MEIANIYRNIQLYKDELVRLANKSKEIEKLLSNLNSNRLEKMSYSEIRDFYKKVEAFVDKETEIRIMNIKNRKKGEEYPDWLGVHYFPEIKEMTWLTAEEQREIDQTLAHCPNNKIGKFSTEIIQFLIDKNIISKRYTLACDCDCWDCEERVLTEDYVTALKAYWEKEKAGITTTTEENENCNYGVVEIYCNYEIIEITCLEEFERYLTTVSYKKEKSPDTTLDKI